jgi:hypothetical protein
MCQSKRSLRVPILIWQFASSFGVGFPMEIGGVQYYKLSLLGRKFTEGRA